VSGGAGAVAVGILLAVATGACGSASVPHAIAPTAVERRAASAVALGTAPAIPVAGADRSLRSAAAEAGLHAVAASLGPFGTTAEPLGRTPDGRFLTRIEVHAVAVSRWPHGASVTGSQRRAAGRLVDRTEAAAARYRDLAAAEAAGFRRVDEMHYVDEAAVRDGRILDPRHPEALMFMGEGRAARLVGVMYLAEGRARGPQLGGPLTTWHYHLFGAAVCMVGGGFPIALAARDGSCAQGAAETRSPEMLHVWLGVPRAQAFSPGMDTVPMTGHPPAGT
jgi:hypothetical protein